MRSIREHDGRRFLTAELAAIDLTEAPFGGSAYPCLLWDHQGCTSDATQAVIAQALVEGGCRYAVCAGQDAERWHMSFDSAFLSVFGTDDAAWGDNFVMTTGHSGESPDDVAHFFVMNTNFENHDFRDYLVLHVGEGLEGPALEAAVWMYAAPTHPNKSLERPRER